MKNNSFFPPVISILWNPIYIIRRSLLKHIQQNQGFITGRTLDFGCGSKPYQHVFTNISQYIGLEIETGKNRHQGCAIDYFYNGEKIPFDSTSFDSVVSFEVFEHVFNLNTIMRELNRVLKPNGHLLISIPFAWEEHEQPVDFARYTSFGIKKILNDNKFDVLKITKTTSTILALSSLFTHYVGRSTCQNIFIKTFARLLVIGPANLIALFLDKIVLQDNLLFCNLVVLCKKKS